MRCHIDIQKYRPPMFGLVAYRLVLQPHHHMGVQKNRHTHTHIAGASFFCVQNTFLPRLVSMKFIVFWIFINLFGVQAPLCSWKPGWNQVVYINVGWLVFCFQDPDIVKFWNNHQISSEFIWATSLGSRGLSGGTIRWRGSLVFERKRAMNGAMNGSVSE